MYPRPATYFQKALTLQLTAVLFSRFFSDLSATFPFQHEFRRTCFLPEFNAIFAAVGPLVSVPMV